MYMWGKGQLCQESDLHISHTYTDLTAKSCGEFFVFNSGEFWHTNLQNDGWQMFLDRADL